MSTTPRPLGTTGLSVGPLAFGGNVFGWTADEPTSFALLDAFAASGLNLLDTADVYSRWVPGQRGGESETVIGKWLKSSGRRGDIVLATKVGMDMGDAGKGLSRAHILQSCERSLNRLQTDTIDLYQAHQDDAATPLDETLGAFGELIAAGKVRAVGASNYTAARLGEALRVSDAHKLPRYGCLQPLYNLSDRAVFEAELQPLCERERVGVIPYYSLASGFLTGKYRDLASVSGRPREGRLKGYFTDRGHRILAALDAMAGRHGSTPARVALAWLTARPAVTAPIVSATSVEQWDDVVQTTKLSLAPADIAELDAASAERMS